MRKPVFMGNGRETRDSSDGKSLKERFYKSMVFFGLGVSYRGLKGWMKARRERH